MSDSPPPPDPPDPLEAQLRAAEDLRRQVDQARARMAALHDSVRRGERLVKRAVWGIALAAVSTVAGLGALAALLFALIATGRIAPGSTPGIVFLVAAPVFLLARFGARLLVPADKNLDTLTRELQTGAKELEAETARLETKTRDLERQLSDSPPDVSSARS